jgi:hypothetical protein
MKSFIFLEDTSLNDGSSATTHDNLIFSVQCKLEKYFTQFIVEYIVSQVLHVLSQYAVLNKIELRSKNIIFFIIKIFKNN